MAGAWPSFNWYPFSYYSVLIREPKKKKGKRVLLENLGEVVCSEAGICKTYRGLLA